MIVNQSHGFYFVIAESIIFYCCFFGPKGPPTRAQITYSHVRELLGQPC